MSDLAQIFAADRGTRTIDVYSVEAYFALCDLVDLWCREHPGTFFRIRHTWSLSAQRGSLTVTWHRRHQPTSTLVTDRLDT